MEKSRQPAQGQSYLTVEDLGALVRQARKHHRLTQAELALASGVGTRMVGDLENGKDTAQIGKILQIIAALGGRLSLEWNQVADD